MIDSNVKARLERAIEALFKSGRDTHYIRDALAKQESFGKYEGCTPTAILELANAVGRKINAKIREDNKHLARTAREAFNRNFSSQN